ncbi:hypothetical protein RRG08_040446 [Elysia crispata]|nr:hypothetical protein RRG08_040446 [Elysia crispata]
MAESVNSENPTTVYDLEGEDFFERFNLKRVKVLGKGMAGEVFLVKPKSGSGRMLAVKKFSLSEDVRERSMRQFSTEAGVMQIIVLTISSCYMSHVALNDNKLENVFVDRSDRAILGDLGLALEVKDDSKTAIAGLVGGTRNYWAPEILQADTHARIDPFKSDVYAMGVMYWSLVSGEDPATGTDFLGRLRAAQDLDLSPSQRSTLERLLEPNPVERPTASGAVKMMNMK